jgi:hypothetical protein
MKKTLSKKIRFVVVTGCITLVAAGVVLAVLLHPLLKNTIITVIEKTTGCRCRIERVAYVFPARIRWYAMQLDSFAVESCEVAVTIPRGSVHLRPVAFLTHRSRIRREIARIDSVVPDSALKEHVPADAAAGDTVLQKSRRSIGARLEEMFVQYRHLRDTRFAQALHSLHLREMSLQVDCPAIARAAITNAHVRLECTPHAAWPLTLHSDTVSLALYNDTMHVASPYILSESEVQASLGDSLCRLDSASIALAGGRVTMRGDIDVQSGGFSRMQADVRALDIHRLAAYAGLDAQKATLTGTVYATAELSGSFADIPGIHGSGRLRLSDVTAANTSLQENFLVALFMKEITTLRFSRITSAFRIEDSRIYNTDTHGVGTPLEFFSEGWIGYDQHLQQRLKGIVSTGFAEKLPRMVRTAMDPTDDDRRAFRCTIDGSLHTPSVQFDRSHYNRVIHNAVQGLEKGIKRLFGGN